MSATPGQLEPPQGNGARRAKIVCTLGPACSSEAMLRQLLRLGMDVARLNFSHGTHEEHARMLQRVRHAAELEGRSICVLQDLQGPKIRTGRLKDRRPVLLRARAKVTITPRDIPGTSTLLATTYPHLASDVKTGERVLLADGLIELRVIALKGADVECQIVNGGMLGEHKGINLPGSMVRVPAMTEKDKKDLDFGLKHGVDAVALSFVRTAEDVRLAKRLIDERGQDVPVIAKLEKSQAIEHLEEILDVADGVMVARGDLGVEMPPEKVPVIQKHIIQRAAEWRKPVITATQMLESMIENPRPTRAEASDVANAIFDGSDAVMLSAETASGKYPREAVAMMGRIICEAEEHMNNARLEHRRREARTMSIAEAICESVAHAAQDLDMKAIAVFTESGRTARLISKYRPKAQIYAFTMFPAVRNRMNLLWGVHPVNCPSSPGADAMVTASEGELLRRGVVRVGDIMGVVAGTRMASGSTNFMRLHVVSDDDGEHNHDRRKAPHFRPAASRRRT